MVGPLQEADGAISMRRVLAIICTAASIVLAIYAFPFASAGWYVFVPAILYQCAAMVLMFFTTWEDVASIAKAVKG